MKHYNKKAEEEKKKQEEALEAQKTVVQELTQPKEDSLSDLLDELSKPTKPLITHKYEPLKESAQVVTAAKKEVKMELKPEQKKQVQVMLGVIDEMIPLVKARLEIVRLEMLSVTDLENALLISEYIVGLKKLLVDNIPIVIKPYTRAEQEKLPFDIDPPPLTPDEKRRLAMLKMLVEGSIEKLGQKLTDIRNQIAEGSAEDVITLVNTFVQMRHALV